MMVACTGPLHGYEYCYACECKCITVEPGHCLHKQGIYASSVVRPVCQPKYYKAHNDSGNLVLQLVFLEMC